MILIFSPRQWYNTVMKIRNNDQSWYWNQAWQAGELAAEKEAAARLGEDFETMEAFLKDLGLDLTEVENERFLKPRMSLS